MTRYLAKTEYAAALLALAGLLLVGGCRIQVDKNENGRDKNVKVDTPLGGLHVRTDQTAAADVGLPVYPGAKIAPDKDGDKSADVHLGFGQWQLRVKVVSYDTPDTQDKVLAFYQNALGRYGDVVRCHGNQAEGAPSVTREGLGCSDDNGHSKVADMHDLSIKLKAGSKHHQHIVGIENSAGPGTRFELVELELPQDLDKESN